MNLNLVPVLRALLREKSISRVAEQMNLTQPAISVALAKLRVALNDPLLVKVGRSMRLTQRAEELIEPVEKAWAAIELVLSPPNFNPESAQRTFVVATFDYSAVVIGPQILGALRNRAPGISIHFVNRSLQELRDDLSDIDLMFVPQTVIEELALPALKTQLFLRDRIVYMIGPQSPLYSVSEPTPRQLREHRMVRFCPRDTVSDRSRIRSRGFPFEQVVSSKDIILAEQFSVVSLISLFSNSVSLVPMRLVESLRTLIPLRALETEMEPIDVFMVWSAARDSDGGHRWIRELLFEVGSTEKGHG